MDADATNPMESKMMTLFDDFFKRADYLRTARDLRNLPLDVALDLDIDRKDANRIAHKAVYGY